MVHQMREQTNPVLFFLLLPYLSHFQLLPSRLKWASLHNSAISQDRFRHNNVEDSHPAIVSKEVFDLTQIELERRERSRNYKPTASCFSGKIFCGDCGGLFGSKVWHSNTKYRRTIWQCNSKFKNKCTTAHLTEPVLKLAFVTVFNSMIENKDEVIGFIGEVIGRLLDTTAIDKKIAEQEVKCDLSEQKVQDYIYINSRKTIDQEKYEKYFNELSTASVCSSRLAERLYIKLCF